MNAFIKRTAQLLMPARIFTSVQSIRSRNLQKKLLKEWKLLDATEALIAARGCTVLGGPFRGMKYDRDVLLSRNGAPLLFGSYERELHPALTALLSKQFTRVIDIGCAEGYYAVGMALRRNAEVHAFDCEPRERSYCRRMAKINGVQDRVHVRGWCDRSSVKKLASERSLVIFDCEG